jgi:hypothetical protein
MMEPFAPPAAWFCWPSVPHPRASLWKGLGKVTFKWFSIKIINKKLNYFYCLSVNYNNRSSAVNNGSQNGIHFHRRATIKY